MARRAVRTQVGDRGLAFTLACRRGELQAAAPIEQQFQALIAEHPDPLAIGLGLATSQMLRLLAGDLDGSRRYESQALRTLALTSMLQGRYQQAEDELRECLDVALELGDLAGVALDLDRLGQAAVALGHPERAVVAVGGLPPSRVPRRWAHGGVGPVGDRAST